MSADKIHSQRSDSNNEESDNDDFKSSFHLKAFSKKIYTNFWFYNIMRILSTIKNYGYENSDQFRRIPPHY